MVHICGRMQAYSSGNAIRKAIREPAPPRAGSCPGTFSNQGDMMRLILSTFALLAMTAGPIAAQTAPAEDAAPAAEAAAPAAQPAPADALPGSQDALPDAGTYAFDPDHCHIVWTYEHMGFSTSTGLIRGVTGAITLDPADPGASTVEASFPLSAFQTVSVNLDQHLSGDEFFGGAAPDTAITFKSTAVEVTGDRTAKVTGDVTLNGVTKPLTLDVTMRGVGQDPVVDKPSVGFQATGVLLRSDFDLDAFAPAVSDEVQIEINVEAHKG